jgi:hypothetical protein
MPDKSETLLADPKAIEQVVWDGIHDQIMDFNDPTYRNFPSGEVTETILQIARTTKGLTPESVQFLVSAAVAWWLGVYDAIHEGEDPNSISDAIRDAWSQDSAETTA